jgi:hypothetical protein
MHQEIKAAEGMFWCLPHGKDMPLAEQSPHPRYCLTCWAVLQGETPSPAAPINRGAGDELGNKSPKTSTGSLSNPPASPSVAEPLPTLDEMVQLPLIDGVTPKLTDKAMIKQAIRDTLRGEKKKGTRTIAGELKARGIMISHMKVSRMRTAMIKRGELAHV